MARVSTLTSAFFPRLAAVVALAGAAMPVLAQLEGDDEIIREGTAGRREALDEMELTPFPMEYWELVTDWRLADAPTPETLDGKVVLIMTFAGWYPPSMRSLGVINRMATERAEEGLVVIGVHDAEEWEDGVAEAERREVAFPVGHDAENKFREALMVDQDPDFYVIDRSGQMRFADIETSSVEAAVDLLLAETRDDAATLVDRIADAQLRAEIAARRSRAINQEADLSEIPAVPFVMPGADVFSLQRWPQFPRDPNQPQQQPGQQPTRTIAMPREGWYPAAPTALGRATVVYFFDRRLPQTTDMITDMDALQRRYSRDIQVVGAMTPLVQDQSGSTDGFVPGTGEIVHLVRRTHESMGLAHALVVDPGSVIYNAASGGQNFQSGSTDAPKTFAAVVSSDGVVRWFGNARSPGFESAVDTVARVDPGVRARREAEDEYIRRTGR